MTLSAVAFILVMARGKSRAHRKTLLDHGAACTESDAEEYNSDAFADVELQDIDVPDEQELSDTDKPSNHPGQSPAYHHSAQPSRTAPVSYKNGDKPGRKEVMDISVTLGNGSADLNIAAIQENLQQWMSAHCESAFFGAEKGGNVGKLHLQGVIRRRVAGAAQNTKDLKAALWGLKCAGNNFVNSKGLTGKGLHTWHGLLGYCQKDMHEKHYCTFKSNNITDEDLAFGCDLYCLFGNGDLKNKSVVSTHTIFERASTFYKMKMRSHYDQPSLAQVLLRMHRTGKYYPAAQWVVPTAGHGMSITRANAAWLMAVSPADVKMKHVMNVYFGVDDHDLRYFEVEDDHNDIDMLHVNEGVLHQQSCFPPALGAAIFGPANDVI